MREEFAYLDQIWYTRSFVWNGSIYAQESTQKETLKIRREQYEEDT